MKKQITISIVEDLDTIRRGVQHAIEESEDLLCISAYENAESALEELPVLKPDIILMDINLPGMSGIECIKKIKNQCPGSQFMMFTIYENNEQVFDALAAGASGYLLKKTPHQQILEALRELYHGGAPMSMHIARKVVNAFQQPGVTEDNPNNLLSPREQEVLRLLSKGYLYKEIGDRLEISTGTVRQHIHNIYDKLHVQNRTEALNKYYGRTIL
jgi:DNA-binding NarL/FixJ family response regulator